MMRRMCFIIIVEYYTNKNLPTYINILLALRAHEAMGKVVVSNGVQGEGGLLAHVWHKKGKQCSKISA